MLSAAKAVATKARSWPPLTLHLLYFMGFSVVGFVALKLSMPRTSGLDLCFTSVSATTVSSMSTLDMEVFSNLQLLLLTFLMLLGGDVFISTLSLRLSLYAPCLHHKPDAVQLPAYTGNSSISTSTNTGASTVVAVDDDRGEDEIKLIKARRCLYFVLLAYLLLVHLAGSLSLFLYVSLVDTARDVLRSKGISLLTFSIFTTVSSFANCGFVPTNENMLVFRKNPGLLWLLLPQLFLGTTLFPSSLRFFLSILARFTKRPHFAYVLNHPKEMGFSPHLLSVRRCRLLAATVFGFVFLQLVLFCFLEWDSESLEGMTSYEKFVGALFQVFNSRHAGESVVDLSTLSPAILVLFILMM